MHSVVPITAYSAVSAMSTQVPLSEPSRTVEELEVQVDELQRSVSAYHTCYYSRRRLELCVCRSQRHEQSRRDLTTASTSCCSSSTVVVQYRRNRYAAPGEYQ